MGDQRLITLWRKTGAECLDWDFHISEFADDAPRVVENLKRQGVWQFSTYHLGEIVPDLSSAVPKADAQTTRKEPTP